MGGNQSREIIHAQNRGKSLRFVFDVTVSSVFFSYPSLLFGPRCCSRFCVLSRRGVKNSHLEFLMCSLPSCCLRGLRALVVGGTAGIGKGAACRLAQAGCSVSIVGRDPERGNTVVQEMRARAAAAPPASAAPAASASAGQPAPAASPEPQFEFIPCNCFLMSNIRDVCAQFQQAHPDGLDFLVLSQGMATFQVCPLPAS